MIYTVTFNPSLDYIVSVKDFRPGMTNRTSSELMLAGGKGINVSIVLGNLGIKSTALGFIAGFTGDEIVRRLHNGGINSEFIKINDGISRINIKLKSIDGTEINGQGPHIDSSHIEQLMNRLRRLESGDVLVLAGSIPAGISDNIYKDIMDMLKDKGVQIVVDATSRLLTNVLEYNPFFIKPNQHELGDIFNVTLNTQEEVIPYALKLKKMGAVNVCVSMGGKGAILVADDGNVYKAKAPDGILKNSVGAGDSLVAGFLSGWIEKKDYEYAFRKGVATGSASAFSERLATVGEVNMLIDKVVITR
ncbi:1-phosphofructokinase [Lachnospira sp. CLA-JM-H23]|uniref:1-phosphofructokinase n=1 Tax=Lachnospira sp. CLA-JM-H23 TaxID=3133092 RepID=UPI0032BFFAA8